MYTNYFEVKVIQSCPTFFNPMNMEFSRPEYWPFSMGAYGPSPWDLPDPGITLQADSLPAEPQGGAQEYWSG